MFPQVPRSLQGPQPRHGDWADDGDLAEEIQLYGDLVVAASESERPLTPAEIDCALGLAGERAARSAARA